MVGVSEDIKHFELGRDIDGKGKGVYQLPCSFNIEEEEHPRREVE